MHYLKTPCAHKTFLGQPLGNAAVLDIMKHAALKGLGIAVLSERLVQNEIETGALKCLKVPSLNLKRQFSIVYHKNKYFSEITQAFIAQCQSDINSTKC